MAQVWSIPPFIGTHLETWDDAFHHGQHTSPVNPSFTGFNGMAVFTNPNLSIYQTANHLFENGLGLGLYMAKTESGMQGLAKSAISTMPVIIIFNEPIIKFGGYWAALSGYSPNISHAIDFQFYDGNDNPVGTYTFVYSEPNYNGTLEWIGWEFDRPVTRIEYAAWFVGGDSLRITVIPEPNQISTIIPILSILLLGSCWKNRTSRKSLVVTPFAGARIAPLLTLNENEQTIEDIGNRIHR